MCDDAAIDYIWPAVPACSVRLGAVPLRLEIASALVDYVSMCCAMLRAWSLVAPLFLLL
jgi:hypothetical protein